MVTNTQPCTRCDGEGSIHTGIDEAPTTLCRACDGSGTAPARATCISPLATRPVLYTDSVGGKQVCRDDLWAVTTEELNSVAPREQADERALAEASYAKRYIGGGAGFPSYFNGWQDRAALIQQAAAEAPTPENIAAMIHYPQCWDTAAYPNVESAIKEIITFNCSECGGKGQKRIHARPGSWRQCSACGGAGNTSTGAAPEAPATERQAEGKPYFRDLEFDPPSGLFTTAISLDPTPAATTASAAWNPETRCPACDVLCTTPGPCDAAACPMATTASASDGSIYESVSRRADPEGHAEALAQIDEVLARATAPSRNAAPTSKPSNMGQDYAGPDCAHETCNLKNGECDCTRAALTQQSAAQALPPPELTWLYTHCKAIGMNCKSDSGKWEHDIALFTTNLVDAAQAAHAGAVEMPLYTCKGKGGEYELIGVAYGAGASRGTTVNLYRETATGVKYFRTPADFAERMERIALAATEKKEQK